MTASPLISCVIVNWNRRDLLRACLALLPSYRALTCNSPRCTFTQLTHPITLSRHCTLPPYITSLSKKKTRQTLHASLIYVHTIQMRDDYV